METIPMALEDNSSKLVAESTNMNTLSDISTTLAATSISSHRTPASCTTSSTTSYPKTEADPSTSDEPHSGPLRSFHPFPLLPTELRLEIWNLALPASKRLYLITVSTKPNEPCSLPLGLDFSIDGQKNTQTSFQDYTVNLDIGMLRANKEARAVYLSENSSALALSTQALPSKSVPNSNTATTTTPHTTKTAPKSSPSALQGEVEGRLHFNSQHTIFFIRHYEKLQRNEDLANACKKGGTAIEELRIQLEVIRHIATRNVSFYPSVERPLWSGKGGGPSISIFRNLDTWYNVPNFVDRGGAAKEEIRRTRKRLELFRDRFNNGWKMPKIELWGPGPKKRG
ncbi:hypothetical protein VTL71DRAFT_4738 [Oculimacula yallundae]|uniref:2EXR domain-containing protein n=1 Tax=Oculimacula yallundae TaxID=86028 RepID=A0ABR4C2V6_9HELO